VEASLAPQTAGGRGPVLAASIPAAPAPRRPAEGSPAVRHRAAETSQAAPAAWAGTAAGTAAAARRSAVERLPAAAYPSQRPSAALVPSPAAVGPQREACQAEQRLATATPAGPGRTAGRSCARWTGEWGGLGRPLPRLLVGQARERALCLKPVLCCLRTEGCSARKSVRRQRESVLVCAIRTHRVVCQICVAKVAAQRVSYERHTSYERRTSSSAWTLRVVEDRCPMGPKNTRHPVGCDGTAAGH